MIVVGDLSRVEVNEQVRELKGWLIQMWLVSSVKSARGMSGLGKRKRTEATGGFHCQEVPESLREQESSEQVPGEVVLLVVSYRSEKDFYPVSCQGALGYSWDLWNRLRPEKRSENRCGCR